MEQAAAGFEQLMVELAAERARGDSSSRLQFPPGSQYQYNNFNYNFLAYDMERVTGHYWETILRERVLVPAGMSSTRYDRVHAIVPGRARGYRLQDTVILTTDYDDHEAYAAGGLLSTVDDLARFVKAVVLGSLLRGGLRAAMLRPGLGDYGLGWQITQSYGRTLYNHTGNIRGFASYLGYYPGDDVLVVVLSNVENEPARGTGCDLAGLALGRPVSGIARQLRARPARSDQLDPRALGSYVGTGDGKIRDIAVDDGGRVRYRLDGSAYTLLYAAPDSFTVAESRETLIRLTRASTGTVTGFRIERCGGLVTEAVRR